MRFFQRNDLIPVVFVLLVVAGLLLGKATAGAPPPCCTQAHKLAKGALSALEALPPDHPAARSLESAMNSAFGPCRREGRTLYCEGL